MIFALADIGILLISFLSLYFSIFWLLALFEREDEKIGWLDKDMPLVSVIIPAYNEERSIQETMRSVLELDYPKDKIEIVVVNDGSKDNTREKVEETIKKNKDRIIMLVNQDNRGKGNAMNNGLRHVHGEFFASLDADSFVAGHSLKSMLPYFADKRVAAVCPLLKVKEPRNIIQRIQWYEYLVNMFYKRLNAKLDCVHVTPGPFSLYRTEYVKAVGGYDEESIAEDMELAINLQAHDYRLMQDMDSEVYTLAPDNFSGLYKQRNRWYKGTLYNSLKYKGMFFNKKYGDFGVAKLPMVIASSIVAVLLLFLGVNELFKVGRSSVLYLMHNNFNIPLIVSNAAVSIDLLKMDFTKLSLGAAVLSLGIFVVSWSHKYTKEKVLRFGSMIKTFACLAYYMTLYGLFITGVWLIVMLEVLFGKKQRW
ncbi:glycosyltransferase family 2 protein [archaeon]|nr:glycosyltransferase family 2 protein [archaeon]